MGNLVTPDGMLKYFSIAGVEARVLNQGIRLLLTVAVLLSAASGAAFLFFHRELQLVKAHKEQAARKVLTGANDSPVSSPQMKFCMPACQRQLSMAAWNMTDGHRSSPPAISMSHTWQTRPALTIRRHESRRMQTVVLVFSACVQPEYVLAYVSHSCYVPWKFEPVANTTWLRRVLSGKRWAYDFMR